MTEVTHQPCDMCGSSDAFSYNTEKEVGYCHACGKPKKMSTEPIKLEEIEYTYEDARGISKAVREFYTSPVGYHNGKPVAHRYGYPDNTKLRLLPKDFSKNSGFKSDKLFGMDKFQAGASRTLTIVEGEEDAMATYEMLDKRWPVVSLPSAAISKALLKNCKDYIDSFQQVVICTDNDEAGDKAATTLAELFPNKVYRVKLDLYKDPNDYLIHGKDSDFKYAWINRQKYVPDNTYNTAEQFLGILRDKETNVYLPTRVKSFNEMCKGLMQGHLTIITGPEGQGKTEFLRMMEYDVLKNSPDKPIAVLHMEESKKTTLLGYGCYELGVNVRDPDTTVPQDEIDKAILELTANENLYLFEMSNDEDPLGIVDKVRYFTKVCGCAYIFIDPIQQLAYQSSSEMTDEQVLTSISVQLSKLATEYNVGIVMTTHVNDDGQVRTSRMIGKSASIRIDLERDHMSTDATVRNTTKISVSKNRPVGMTGYCGDVFFDTASFTLSEADYDAI